MIQTSQFTKICEQHEKKIISLCFNPNCSQNRLACFDCISNDFHCGHQRNLKEFKYLDIILDEAKIEYDNLITILSQRLEEILSIYYQLQKGIEYKYNLPAEKINFITNAQLNQYISNVILFKEQAETIKKQMEFYFEDFMNKLNSQMIELQLEQLSYIEVSQDDQMEAEQFFNYGYDLYWNKKDFAGAIKLFNKALSYNHKHLMSLWCKGESLRLLGKSEESIEWYDKALSIDSRHVQSMNGKGEALKFIGQYNKSIELFDKTLLIDQKNVSSLFGKGDVLRQLNKYKESILCYDNALLINPKHANSIFGKAEALRFLGEYMKSIEQYDNVLTIDPFHIQSLYGKGESLRMLENYQQSLNNFDQVLEKYPNHSLSLGSKGACLNSMQKYKEAFDCLSKALKIDTNHQFYLDQMKICKEKLQK